MFGLSKRSFLPIFYSSPVKIEETSELPLIHAHVKKGFGRIKINLKNIVGPY